MFFFQLMKGNLGEILTPRPDLELHWGSQMITLTRANSLSILLCVDGCLNSNYPHLETPNAWCIEYDRYPTSNSTSGLIFKAKVDQDQRAAPLFLSKSRDQDGQHPMTLKQCFCILWISWLVQCQGWQLLNSHNPFLLSFTNSSLPHLSV